jgi:hypothetical protein
MAKVNSLIKISGTLDDHTFVRSATYGDHVRRKRGSVKQALVNEAFRKSSEELRIATPYAKLIKDSVNPYLIYFKDWTLWSRLRSFFRKQIREGDINYQQLVGFEFHKAHSLYSLLRNRPNVNVYADEKEIRVHIRFHMHPHFPVSYVDGYQFTILAIVVDAVSKSVRTFEHISTIRKLTDKLHDEQQLRFSREEHGGVLIVALKCEGCKGNDVMRNVKTQGMAVVHVSAPDEMSSVD